MSRPFDDRVLPDLTVFYPDIAPFSLSLSPLFLPFFLCAYPDGMRVERAHIMPDTKPGEPRNGGHARCENNARIFGSGRGELRDAHTGRPLFPFSFPSPSCALLGPNHSSFACPGGGSSFRHTPSRGGRGVRYVPMSREDSNRKWKRGTDAVAHTPLLMSRSPINWNVPCTK